MMPYGPAARTEASTACETSVSRLPARTWARPCQSAVSQTSSSRARSGLISPTPTVMAASPCQPSTIAPQSIEMMSPSPRMVSGPGMPCTMTSLGEVQITAG
jgi:hypothetical protein